MLENVFDWTHCIIGIMCFIFGFLICAFFTIAKMDDIKNENVILKNKLKKYVAEEINKYIN